MIESCKVIFSTMAAEGGEHSKDDVFTRLLENVLGEDAPLVRARLAEIINHPEGCPSLDMSNPRSVQVDVWARNISAGFGVAGLSREASIAERERLNCMERLDAEMLTRGPSRGVQFEVLGASDRKIVRDFVRRMSTHENRHHIGVKEEDRADCVLALETIRWNHLKRDHPIKKTPEEFRGAAKIIIKALVKRTVEQMGLTPQNTVIGLMWRSALPMGAAFAELGFKRFVHINGQRREHDATTMVHSETRSIILQPDDIVVIPDPMRATGQSVDKALAEMGVKPGDKRKLVSMAVIAAPEGDFFLGRKYAQMHFFTAALDEFLNQAAFICKGLGDFGDQFFADVRDELLEIFIEEWCSIGLLTDELDIADLRARFASHYHKA